MSKCLSLICYRVYVSKTNGNWGNPFIDIVGLEDPRQTPDPLPLLYFGADEVAKNISYIHFSLHCYDSLVSKSKITSDLSTCLQNVPDLQV